MTTTNQHSLRLEAQANGAGELSEGGDDGPLPGVSSIASCLRDIHGRHTQVSGAASAGSGES